MEAWNFDNRQALLTEFLTHAVKERISGQSVRTLEHKVYEVMYNVSEIQVLCLLPFICIQTTKVFFASMLYLS